MKTFSLKGPQIKNTILACDMEALNFDSSCRLLENSPSSDEVLPMMSIFLTCSQLSNIQLYLSNGGEKGLLGEVESFFLEAPKFPYF